MLELRHITVRFGDRIILDDLDLSLHPKDHHVLTGPSGSGKSTLLKTLLLFYPPDSGQIYWEGEPVTPKRLAIFRANFLYIGQKPLPFDGTVGQYLDLPFAFAANAGIRPDHEHQNELMKCFRLDPALRGNLYHQLSGGEKQRMTIVQGIQLNRPFCLFDEITSSLDPESRQAVIGYFANDSGRAILSIAHQREWLTHGFKALRLEEGKIVSVTDNEGRIP